MHVFVLLFCSSCRFICFPSTPSTIINIIQSSFLKILRIGAHSPHITPPDDPGGAPLPSPQGSQQQARERLHTELQDVQGRVEGCRGRWVSASIHWFPPPPRCSPVWLLPPSPWEFGHSTLAYPIFTRQDSEEVNFVNFSCNFRIFPPLCRFRGQNFGPHFFLCRVCRAGNGNLF